MSADGTGAGLLIAAPGSSDPAASAVFERIDRAAEARFPGVVRRWGFTSRGVRLKVAARGETLAEPAVAMAELRAAGAARIAVLPLHLSGGMEYRELCAAVSVGHGRVAIGEPLLANPALWLRAAAALWRETAAAGRGDAALILVAHGSREEPGRVADAAACAGRISERLMLGALMGPPGPEDLARRCRESGIRSAWLMPCMTAAGLSAKREIAGPDAGSWRTRLEAGGVSITPVLRGLGECEDVVRVWMDQAAALLAGLAHAEPG